jgi:hypothetical protein
MTRSEFAFYSLDVAGSADPTCRQLLRFYRPSNPPSAKLYPSRCSRRGAARGLPDLLYLSQLCAIYTWTITLYRSPSQLCRYSPRRQSPAMRTGHSASQPYRHRQRGQILTDSHLGSADCKVSIPRAAACSAAVDGADQSGAVRAGSCRLARSHSLRCWSC